MWIWTRERRNFEEEKEKKQIIGGFKHILAAKRYEKYCQANETFICRRSSPDKTLVHMFGPLKKKNLEITNKLIDKLNTILSYK